MYTSQHVCHASIGDCLENHKFESRIHLWAVWPQASHLASLSLHSLPRESEAVFRPMRMAIFKNSDP